MADYKLSFSGTEIDDELKKIEDGGVGYTEPGKVLSFSVADSNDDGFIFGGCVKVTDEGVDLTTAKRVTVTPEQGGEASEVVELTEFTVKHSTESGFISDMLVANDDGEDFDVAWCVHETVCEIQKGTYLLITENTRLELDETIHPIDPKYMPGAVLPVVELSEETCNALLVGETATLTEAEAAVFMAAKDNINPVVVKIDVGIMRLAAIATLTVLSGEPIYIADTVWSGMILFAFTDSGMTARLATS